MNIQFVTRTNLKKNIIKYTYAQLFFLIDILLIGLYIRDERYYWAIITAVFFILPGIVIQVCQNVNL